MFLEVIRGMLAAPLVSGGPEELYLGSPRGSVLHVCDLMAGEIFFRRGLSHRCVGAPAFLTRLGQDQSPLLSHHNRCY